MNGRLLLDTNAVIALLKGHTGVGQLLLNATWVGIPVIVELEFLSFPNLSAADESLFTNFKNRVEVIDLRASNDSLLKEIVQIRRNAGVKLPDAIIAASAIQSQATLVSNDAVFSKVPQLALQTF